MRTEREIKYAMDAYSDTVRRLCFVYLKNHADTEDIFQNVFIKYAYCDKEFESREHEKAWFIRVTINQCKDLLKSFFHSNAVLTDGYEDFDGLDGGKSESEVQLNSRVLAAVSALPKKYKVPIYLHYIEGYSAVEIGKLMRKNVNTIYTNLDRGRKMLKETLERGEME